MARSRQKTPIFGHTTATSEKYDKRKANRALRAHVRVALAADVEVLPERWPGKFGQGDKWISCLRPATMPRQEEHLWRDDCAERVEIVHYH